MSTYYIITIGCQMNKSDSERLASALERQGYKLCGDKYAADLVVINTCGVRQSAEDRVYGLLPRIKAENPACKIVLTGCLAGREDVKKRLKGCVDEWMMINKIFNFQFSIFNKFSKSNFQTNANAKCEKDYLKIKPKYNSKLSAYVPIGNGCDNFCSYCVVPYARGREAYRAAGDILADASELVNNGYKEIILIAQNVNSYFNPLNPPLQGGQVPKPPFERGARGVNFAGLLKAVNSIPGDFKIKFATSHPKDMTDELIEAVASCEKVVKEIHLPVQSGDDVILKKMNRRYTVAHYKKLIKKIRLAMPKAMITTDVIVGFPGETKKQFNNTVKLFKQVKFFSAYIARYSPRPGTAAYKLTDDVPATEKKRRWQELNDLMKRKDLGG
ncbi:MAG: MiaB/RimO family radical SAM methylthiotransferase [bacterium]|nr:MiaB/RimO family radical SAM methylthiotransferase [bacterium]